MAGDVANPAAGGDRDTSVGDRNGDVHVSAGVMKTTNKSVLFNIPRGRICSARLRRMSAEGLTADVSKRPAEKFATGTALHHGQSENVVVTGR